MSGQPIGLRIDIPVADGLSEIFEGDGISIFLRVSIKPIDQVGAAIEKSLLARADFNQCLARLSVDQLKARYGPVMILKEKIDHAVKRLDPARHRRGFKKTAVVFRQPIQAPVGSRSDEKIQVQLGNIVRGRNILNLQALQLQAMSKIVRKPLKSEQGLHDWRVFEIA